MKNKHGKLLALLWILLLFTTGCSTKKEDIKPASDASLITGEWILTEPASAYTVTLRITAASSQWISHYGVEFSGRSSVNSYFGKANFSQGPSIESGEAGTGRISGLGATKMAGPPAAMQFEEDYFARLEAVNRAELVGTDRLRLSYGGATPGVLVYKRQ